MFAKRALLLGLTACVLVVTGCTVGVSRNSVSEGSVRVSIEPDGTAAVNPVTPITVRAEHGKLTGVTMTNAGTGARVDGALAPDGTAWTATEPLGYASRYTVVASAVGDRGKRIEQHGEISTLAPRAQAEPNLIPAPESVRETGVGVGQPIVFQFSQPVEDRAAVERRLSVVSRPAQQGGWYWIDDRNVHYRPQEYWRPGTELTVNAKIYGVDFGNGVYGARDRTERYRVHDSWIAEADGATERMRIVHNGEQVKSMPISMGKDATPTHSGTHVISAKYENYTMDSCTYGVCQGDPGYYRAREHWSQRISTDGEFVHENPNSVGQQGDTNVSHGCINLDAANATWFFDHLGLGDVVEVVNSGGPELPVWDLYGDWSLSWAEWQAGSALR
nr:Ig-like domain-containing protein [Amycolatopsis cihanbeyliensis]